jgi:hypothetical protein
MGSNLMIVVAALTPQKTLAYKTSLLLKLTKISEGCISHVTTSDLVSLVLYLHYSALNSADIKKDT